MKNEKKKPHHFSIFWTWRTVNRTLKGNGSAYEIRTGAEHGK